MAIRNVFSNRDGREKKSLANKEYYETVVNSKKDATFLTDTEGDLFLLNKKAQLLTGFSDEEVREFHVRDIFVTLKNTNNPFDSRQFSEFTSRLYLIDSGKRLIPVMVDFKEIEGQKFLCTCVEMDEKEMPAAGRETTVIPHEEAPSGTHSQGTGELQMRITVDFEHRVRTLLNNLLGFGSILARDPSMMKDKKLAGTLDSMLKSGNQIKTLFNQVSIGETDSYEVVKNPVLLETLLQKACLILEPVSRQNNTGIKYNENTGLTVLSDEILLLETLRFLLEKAVLFTRNDEVSVLISESAGKVNVSIDNLGQDIPQGVINFIKRETGKDHYDLENPLIMNNQEMKALLHTLNRIDAKITFATGSTMGETAILTLPASMGNATTDELTALENAIRQKHLNVLIVEDEKFTAKILMIYLEGIADVSLAYSGNEALNITETFYNNGKVFNAVITDVGLPKPWDGILLKTEMEKRWPEYRNVPFLAQTAFTSKSYMDRIVDNKFTGFLLKPVNRSDVLRFLDRHCK